MAKIVSHGRLPHLYREPHRIEPLAPLTMLILGRPDASVAMIGRMLTSVRSLISVHVSPAFNERRAIPMVKTIPPMQLVTTGRTRRLLDTPTRSLNACARVASQPRSDALPNDLMLHHHASVQLQ